MTPEELFREAEQLFDEADELEHEVRKIKLQLEHANLDLLAGKPFDPEWAALANFAMKAKIGQVNLKRRKGSAIRKEAKAGRHRRLEGDIKEEKAIALNNLPAELENAKKIYQTKNQDHFWRDITYSAYKALKEVGAIVRTVYVTESNDDNGRNNGNH